VRSKSYY